MSYVLAADGLNNIIRRSSKQFSDDGELVDVVLAREQRLALEHLGKDTANTPDIDLNIVLLPGEHDLGGSVISCRDVTGHLRVLDTGQTEVANLQIAVLVDQDVARLQIAVDDTSRVDVFQSSLETRSVMFLYAEQLGRTHQNLVEEVLDELLLERSRGQEAVEIGAQELGDEIAKFGIRGRD